MGSARNGRDGVTELVTGRADAPLSNAERQRRYRQRKAERARAGSGVSPDDGSWTPAFPGQRQPFRAGNTAGVVTGVNSPARVGELAAQVLAELLGGKDCPEHLRDGGGQYKFTLELWASSMAQCRMLRSWLDGQDVLAAMTEVTQGEETEVRPSMGSAKRSVTSRRVASVIDQLHKCEVRAGNLSARLGLDPLARVRMGKDPRPGFDLALYWAQRADGEDAAG